MCGTLLLFFYIFYLFVWDIYKKKINVFILFYLFVILNVASWAHVLEICFHFYALYTDKQ